MAYRIITHNGKAHMDELLAISLIAVYRNELPGSVERVSPHEAVSLASSLGSEKDTYFIDCGLVYDSEKLMFDHHQDADLPSSAGLVFEQYFPLLSESRFHEYIKLVSVVDTKGQKALADFETSSESRRYFSFSQNILLKSFEENPLSIVSLFMEGIREKIDFEEKRIKASEWLSEDGNVELTEHCGVKVLVYNRRPPSGLFQAARSSDKDLVDRYEADAVYSFDEENESARTFYRTNHGYDNIDFTRAEVSERLFCHNGGFLLKFVPAAEDEWTDIIMQSSLCIQPG